MTCTRVLHALARPQPVDLAMCLTHSQHQPIYQLIAMSPWNSSQHGRPSPDYAQITRLPSLPLHPTPVSSLAAAVPRSCLRKCSALGIKKRVAFADTKGLALTAVRVFIPEASCCATYPAWRIFSDKPQQHRWRLGFPQQIQDPQSFPERLRDALVQLEACNLSQHSLSGRIYSIHSGPERSVHVRVTFDSWRSHHDIPCTFSQNQQSGGSDVDVFTFDLSLPQNVDPLERVEFCVSFRAGSDSTQHWDNNRGQNYRLYVDRPEPSVSHSGRHFSYPSLSKHRLSWPSNVAAGGQPSATQSFVKCKPNVETLK